MIYLYPEDIKVIEELVKLRKYDSVSEFVRKAVREKVEREYKPVVEKPEQPFSSILEKNEREYKPTIEKSNQFFDSSIVDDFLERVFWKHKKDYPTNEKNLEE